MSGSTITPWVVGNWKMNPMRANANQLIEEFKQLLQQNQIADENCHVGVAPVSIALTTVQAQLQDAARTVYTVAQDVSRVAGTGAYTGEVSAELLKDSQINFVLVGHSERRDIFGDNVEILKAKLQNALNAGMTVIYCVGESLEQREQGQAEQVVLQQICDIAPVVTAEQWQNQVVVPMNLFGQLVQVKQLLRKMRKRCTLKFVKAYANLHQQAQILLFYMAVV